MPGYKSHLKASLACAALACIVLIVFAVPISLAHVIEWTLCCLIGSLMPDLDIKSFGQTWLFRLLFFIGLIFILKKEYKGFAYIAFVSYSPLLVKHRGLFHDAIFMSVFIFCVTYGVSLIFPCYANILYYDAVFLWLGAVSHILLDKLV